LIDKQFWSGKRVFLTGHTGFKGSWMSLWLHSLGAIIKGYSLEPNTFPSLFNEAKVNEIIDSNIGDIRNLVNLQKSLIQFDPDILIHMAAQPLVRYSYDKPIETYEVNVIGTAKVLEAALSCNKLKAIINITTDKCYENEESDKKYMEDDPLGGFDPYSSSKACSEIISSAYYRSFFQNKKVGLATARSGNVIGGGDWAQDRLIPDILRSFQEKKSVIVRSPKSIRPWQHVLEPISGYLTLAQKLYCEPEKFSEGWNFGPNEEDAKSVEWILNKMILKWPNATWKLDKNYSPHEANFLKLDIEKAKSRLCWLPAWNIEYSIDKSIEWHQAWLNKQNMQDFCVNQINQYIGDMKK
jgi:CDP-glucose 4,6-dehydratase